MDRSQSVCYLRVNFVYPIAPLNTVIDAPDDKKTRTTYRIGTDVSAAVVMLL